MLQKIKRLHFKLQKHRLKVLLVLPVSVFLVMAVHFHWMTPDTYIKKDRFITKSEEHKSIANRGEHELTTKRCISIVTILSRHLKTEPIQSTPPENVSSDRSHQAEMLKSSSFQKKEDNSLHLHKLLSKEKQKYELHLNKTKHVNNETYLCAQWNLGRFGNTLFIYASLFGIAKDTNATFVIEENAQIRNYFKHLKAEIIPENSTICKNVFYFSESKPCMYDHGAYKFPRNRNIMHSSYLQSYYYFKNVEDDIRKQFTFKDEIVLNARQRIQTAVSTYGHNQSNSEIVGIHVRMGDKLGEVSVKEGNLVASKEFYNRSMNYFRMKLKNPVFLIIMSWHNPDDIKWVKQFMTGNDVVLLGSNPLEVDLCAMTLCDHSIMSTGTFGWWGAWLCNGTTVYCKDFAAKGSEMYNNYSPDFKDYFPPNWIGM